MSDEFEIEKPQSSPKIVLSGQGLAVPGERPPSRAPARAHLGTGSSSAPTAANDDTPGVVKIKRTYQRRKSRDADLRCKTMLSSILPEDYDQGRIAFTRSWEIGLGLDTAVTVRPAAFQTMTPEERDREARLFLKRIRSFYADNDDMPPLAYLLTRESEFGDEDGSSEHLHLLIHAGDKRGRLKHYLRGRYTRIEAKVKPASPDRVRLDNGQIGDASTYNLKAVSAPYAKKHDFPHRYSGPVYGTRVFWSENINPVRPRIRVPRPKSKGQTYQAEHAVA